MSCEQFVRRLEPFKRSFPLRRALLGGAVNTEASQLTRSSGLMSLYIFWWVLGDVNFSWSFRSDPSQCTRAVSSRFQGPRVTMRMVRDLAMD